MAVTLIVPRRISDPRGWFCETYSVARHASLGLHQTWVQDNQSLSHATGTLRGLHYQRGPHAQAKLVRCVVGIIFDVVVDLRPASPSFGQWVGVELSAATGAQLLVPAGCAHGFLTLSPDTQVAYKVDAPYQPDADAGVHWADPRIGIAWPLPEGMTAPLTSEKDARLPPLAEAAPDFAYDGTPLRLTEIAL